MVCWRVESGGRLDLKGAEVGYLGMMRELWREDARSEMGQRMTRRRRCMVRQTQMGQPNV